MENKKSRKTEKIASKAPSEYSRYPAASPINSDFDSYELEPLSQEILNLKLNPSITKDVAKESVNATIAKFSGSCPTFKISSTGSISKSPKTTKNPPFSVTGMIRTTATTKECVNGAIAKPSSSDSVFKVLTTGSIPKSLETTEKPTISATGAIPKSSATWVIPTYSATGARPKNSTTKKVQNFAVDQTISSETGKTYFTTTKARPTPEFSTKEAIPKLHTVENELVSSAFIRMMSNCSKASTATKSVAKKSDGESPHPINAKANTESSLRFKIQSDRLDDKYPQNQAVPGKNNHERSSNKTSEQSKDSETVKSICMDFLSFKQNETARIEDLELDLQKTIDVIEITMNNSRNISNRMNDISAGMLDDVKGLNTEITKLKYLIGISQTNLKTIDGILSKFQGQFQNYVDITDNANSSMDAKLAKVMNAILPKSKD